MAWAPIALLESGAAWASVLESASFLPESVPASTGVFPA